MRAILATAMFCLAAFGSVDAQAARRHRMMSPAAAMLAPGLIHMLQSMAKPRADRDDPLRHLSRSGAAR